MRIRVASLTITTNITNSMSKEHRNQGIVGLRPMGLDDNGFHG